MSPSGDIFLSAGIDQLLENRQPVVTYEGGRDPVAVYVGKDIIDSAGGCS